MEEFLAAIVPMDDNERLFLSAAIEDWKPIIERGINTVIDLEGDIDHGVPTEANQFLYVYLPIHDAEMPDMDRLHAVSKLGAELVKRGERVLVHCGLGLNRSALVVGMILLYLGMENARVVEHIRERRAGALYNDVFANYLTSGLLRVV